MLLDVIEGKKHPLFLLMDTSKFFLIKSPNYDFLLNGLKSNEWALSRKTEEKLMSAFAPEISLLFFVTI